MPAGVARLLLFQMCFALYAARDTHAMRHYDVKLLNFLLADFGHHDNHASSSSSSSSVLQENRQRQRGGGKGGKRGGSSSSSTVAVRYGLGPHVYRLPLPKEQVCACVCMRVSYMDRGWVGRESRARPSPTTMLTCVCALFSMILCI